ncbi:MAG: hypothetical protein EON98_02060 [Chitinophagaceae bacterium]|nr:MAG: hypothetical protein EON98_02060 [Chitinophagaceae bacterium]
MYSIITGSLLLSLLHAVIPNHWLPIIAIGRKEAWSLEEITKVTFIAAVAHAASTILIGLLLGFLGAELAVHVEQFTHVFAPALLILLGIIFIYRHHRHKHFHIDGGIKNKVPKSRIIMLLAVAMFFSPCMEIEAYFLLAGAKGAWLLWIIAAVYFLITATGMLLLVRYAYKGILKLNWHSLEHNAGIVTGLTLIGTGIITFFIY